MPTATISPSEQKAKDRAREDAKIVKKGRGRKNPFTAADLGTTSNRLRALGATEVGHTKSGKRGRPAVLFSFPTDQADDAS